MAHPRKGNEEMKFKAGDTVRLKIQASTSAEVGATAIVQDPPYKYYLICDESLLEIIWIRDALSKQQMNGGYSETLFELAEPLPPPKERPTLGDVWGRERWGI
jgi:hypothetical protein